MTSVSVYKRKKKRTRKGPPSVDAPANEQIAYWSGLFKSALGVNIEGDMHQWRLSRRQEIMDNLKRLDHEIHDEEGQTLTLI